MKYKKTKKAFLWYFSKPQINYKTFCNTFEEGSLKNVDIEEKIISLNCFGLKNYLMTTTMIGRFNYIL